uniref:Uncharacterized protein LOC104238123 n=1 Tax=Nicotiana sylvestris TaxID=4096 RepID=A0A1U7XW30_NICSY|nr:PREDICTED: uncharacterized protein LOC104238123 [Nicotiana sylvestris]
MLLVCWWYNTGPCAFCGRIPNGLMEDTDKSQSVRTILGSDGKVWNNMSENIDEKVKFVFLLERENLLLNSVLIKFESQDENEAVKGSHGLGGGGIGRLCGWPSNLIVRVSRASGGKDRHNKVWTSKGLRDRRVSLSVNTAIQFYDLQDRLDTQHISEDKRSSAGTDEIDGDPNYQQQQQHVSLSKKKAALVIIV